MHDFRSLTEKCHIYPEIEKSPGGISYSISMGIGGSKDQLVVTTLSEQDVSALRQMFIRVNEGVVENMQRNFRELMGVQK